MTFLKWCGGKNSLKEKIISYFPKNYDIYIEPFLGSGSIFFKLNPKKAILSDINESLINSFIQVRDNIENLIIELKNLQNTYTSLMFEEKKIMFNEKKKRFNEIKFNIKNNQLESAYLFIFLNKTGFNGMYRENKNGFYNIPIGKQKNICIIDENKIRKCSFQLQDKEIYHLSFDKILELSKKYNNCLIYLDPPYFINENNKFINYNSNSFQNESQYKLKEYFDNLNNCCGIFQSNSYSNEVLELYKEYKIIDFDIKRQINSKIENRKITNKEILIIKKMN